MLLFAKYFLTDFHVSFVLFSLLTCYLLKRHYINCYVSVPPSEVKIAINLGNEEHIIKFS